MLIIPSGAALVGVAVPTPAFTITVPLALVMVTVLVALSKGLSVALPITSPVGGAVSELPAAQVKTIVPGVE